MLGLLMPIQLISQLSRSKTWLQTAPRMNTSTQKGFLCPDARMHGSKIVSTAAAVQLHSHPLRHHLHHLHHHLLLRRRTHSMIFQESLDEKGTGYSWIFFPGKRGEGMLCHGQNDGWHFTSKNGPSNDGVPPWPAGTYHFDKFFDRSCDYMNDGKDNPGMLWCKDKDGQDVGIQYYSDNMRTTKEKKLCTKSGLIPSIEHVAMAYCEW